jgi:hypothetical protein
MKNLIKTNKAVLHCLLWISLLLPVLLLALQRNAGQQSALLGIAAAIGVMVAVIWYIHRVTRGGKDAITTSSTAGTGRIKKSTRLVLEALCGIAIGSFVSWFTFFNSPPMDRAPVEFRIGFLIFIDGLALVWFLQCRSPDKESFKPRIWK